MISIPAFGLERSSSEIRSFILSPTVVVVEQTLSGFRITVLMENEPRKLPLLDKKNNGLGG